MASTTTLAMVLRADDINVRPTLNDLSQGLDKLQEDMVNVGRGTQVMASSSNRGTYALLELSRAAEDATVGFSLNGVQGALRGAGNNISQMALAAGPTTAAITGLALAGTTLLLPMLTRTKDLTGDITAASKKYRDELEELNTEIERLRKANAIGDTKFTDSGEAEKEADKLRKRNASIVMEMERLDRFVKEKDAERQQTIDSLPEKSMFSLESKGTRGDIPTINEINKSFNEELDTTRKRIQSLQDELSINQREMFAAEKQRAELLEKELQVTREQLSGRGTADPFGIYSGKDPILEAQRNKQEQEAIAAEKLEFAKAQLSVLESRQRTQGTTQRADGTERSERSQAQEDLLKSQIDIQRRQVDALNSILNELRNGGAIGVSSE